MNKESIEEMFTESELFKKIEGSPGFYRPIRLVQYKIIFQADAKYDLYIIFYRHKQGDRITYKIRYLNEYGVIVKDLNFKDFFEKCDVKLQEFFIFNLNFFLKNEEPSH